MIKNEIDVLRKTLKEDPDYYYTWQANIAMQFKDLIKYPFKIQGNEEERVCTYKIGEIHEIANQAAKNFLNLLIKDTEDDKIDRLP